MGTLIMKIMENAGPAVMEARRSFPRGMSQPEKGFRFSVDALLLAAFAGQDNLAGQVVDLGTGCGVVGLGLALMHQNIHVAGLDRSSDMLAHARKNAQWLGLGERFLPVHADVAKPGALRPESADMVVCNPPYRLEGSGRVCIQAAKNSARFETQGRLEDFLRASAFWVKNKRACAFIYLAERVDDLLTGLCAMRLRPKELLFVHPREDQPAKLVLVRAVKNGGTSLRVAPPLFLHPPETGDFTPQALAFCPWLAPDSQDIEKYGD